MILDEVLTALRSNLTEHNEILVEAKLGYRTKCKELLTWTIDQLSSRLADVTAGGGIKMDTIHFTVAPPEDHSKEFETIIKMLELHKAAHDGNPANHEVKVEAGGSHPAIPATIELKAADVKRFVLNDWTWMDTFLLSNRTYSAKSMTLAEAKGLV